MRNGKLIDLLSNYPPEMEVRMRVKEEMGLPTDVDWEGDGQIQWLLITDYPVEEKKNDT